MGEIYGILGANGSGKSTLIRLISTLLLPDSGQINFFGYDVVKDSFKFRQMINRVSVEASFFKRLSSEENLVHSARLYGLSARDAREKAEKILVRLGFDATRMDEMMEDLSRGMQQKIAIARALLTSPILLLLDEPTTGLDPKSKRDVQRFINEIRENHDVVVLLTTHDMDEAETLCDHIAIIDKGKFIATGTAEEKTQSPRSARKTSRLRLRTCLSSSPGKIWRRTWNRSMFDIRREAVVSYAFIETQTSIFSSGISIGRFSFFTYSIVKCINDWVNHGWARLRKRRALLGHWRINLGISYPS